MRLGDRLQKAKLIEKSKDWMGWQEKWSQQMKQILNKVLNKGWTNCEWAKWVNHRKYYCNMISVSSRSALSNVSGKTKSSSSIKGGPNFIAKFGRLKHLI